MDTNDKKVKVLIVDDSAMVRKVLSQQLAMHKNIEVVGTAVDPYAARDKIVSLKPDVLTLDIEMPRMDGITFLKKLMQHYPIPVIILSSLTVKGSEMALEALASGAVDVYSKPGQYADIRNLCSELGDRVVAAASAKIQNCSPAESKIVAKKTSTKDYLQKTTDKIIAIGSSTGGVQAIQAVLSTLPADCPGMVIVQHMPAGFTSSFAQRLDGLFEVNVKEAEDGDRIYRGRVLIAPGNKHMIIKRRGADYSVLLTDGPLVCHQRPSVDVMFDSAAKFLGPNAVGVILTGMGSDGAEGLLKMKQNGAKTIAQDEDSCVVYGMPKEAAKLGAADYIVPLNKITAKMLELAD